jgi:hypothetical protein
MAWKGEYRTLFIISFGPMLVGAIGALVMVFVLGMRGSAATRACAERGGIYDAYSEICARPCRDGETPTNADGEIPNCGSIAGDSGVP